ncbi:MAG: hypothetical protein QMD80_01075 [archaeon]|nr:hypothetical protein [archaeon]
MEEDKTKLSTIEMHIKKLFRSGTPANPYFTLHGPSHATAVEKHLQSICENSKISLDEKELYLLLGATWFHDIGMIYGERENHHIKCREYVEALKEDMLFKDDDLELKYIGLICQGHREQINLNSENYNDDMCGEHKIRLGLLTGLLRLADELDLDFRRAPKSLREIFDVRLDDIGRLHWMKHYYVKGIEFSREEDIYNRIFVNVLISIRIPDKNHEEILKKLIIPPLEKTINETRNQLQDNGIRVRIRYQSKIEDIEKLSEKLMSLIKVLEMKTIQEKLNQINDSLKEEKFNDACRSMIDHINASLSSIHSIYHRSTFLPIYLQIEIDFLSKIASQLNQRGIMENDIIKRNCEIINNFFQDYIKWFNKEIVMTAWESFISKVNEMKSLCEEQNEFSFYELYKLKEIIMDLVAFKCTEISGLKFSGKDIERNEWNIAEHISKNLLSGYNIKEIMNFLRDAKVHHEESKNKTIMKTEFQHYLNTIDTLISYYKPIKFCTGGLKI